MKLSIIIPIYNGEKYLFDCMSSITKEIDNQVEVLLIDDGSKDQTATICDSFTSDNVKFFHNENHGVSYSRNFGIKKASGEFIMFVDCDDVLINGWYPTVMAAIKNSTRDIFYLSNRFGDYRLSKREIVQTIIGHGYNGVCVNLASPCSKLYRTAFLREHCISFPDNIINGEDLLFNLQAIFATDSFDIVNQSVYRYRVNYDSATHSYNPYFFQSNTNFILKLKDILKRSSTEPEEIENYCNYCLANSISHFIYRLSLIQSKKQRLQQQSIFDNELYRSYLIKHDVPNQINMFIRMQIFLVRKKWYGVAIFLMKQKTRLNQLRKQSTKNLFEVI